MKKPNVTERPVPCEHVGEVWYDVEGGVDDVRDGEVYQEVVRHRPHSFIRENNPNYWNKNIV